MEGGLVCSVVYTISPSCPFTDESERLHHGAMKKVPFVSVKLNRRRESFVAGRQGQGSPGVVVASSLGRGGCVCVYMRHISQ